MIRIYTKTRHISKIKNFDESMMYGGSLTFEFYKKVSVFGEWKNVFYDFNLDGNLDNISYSNIGIKFNY